MYSGKCGPSAALLAASAAVAFGARVPGFSNPAEGQVGGAREMPVPDSFRCPITHELFKDPVRTVDDHVFERRAIKEWFRHCLNNPVSPVTNLPLRSRALRPDRTLKSLIDEYFSLRAQLQVRLGSYAVQLRAAADGSDDALRNATRDIAAELTALAGEHVERSRSDLESAEVPAEVASEVLGSSSARSPELRGLVQHERRFPGALSSVAWSETGAQLATASEDGTMRVVDVATARVVTKRLHLATSTVHSIAWVRGRVATASRDGMLRLFDAETGRVVQAMRHGNFLYSVAWGSSERLAAGGDDGQLRIVGSASLLPEKQVSLGSIANAVAWSPNGTHVAAWSFNAKLSIVDAVSGHIVRHWPQAGIVRSMAWSLDGVHIAAGGDDCTLSVVEAATGVVVWREPHSSAIRSVAWSRTGDVATGSDNGQLQILDMATGVSSLIEQHDGAVRSVAWSERGTRLATVSFGGTLRIFE